MNEAYMLRLCFENFEEAAPISGFAVSSNSWKSASASTVSNQLTLPAIGSCRFIPVTAATPNTAAGSLNFCGTVVRDLRHFLWLVGE